MQNILENFSKNKKKKSIIFSLRRFQFVCQFVIFDFVYDRVNCCVFEIHSSALHDVKALHTCITKKSLKNVDRTAGVLLTVV
jgi:hypothetical protein